MRNRLRLAAAATALLYIGPLLAGLAGYGWRMIPAFIAIFVLWLIVMRPSLWPREAAAWRQSDVVVAAASQVAVQALLVILCFGIGRGIGGVMGVVPMLAPAFLLALSFLALPLSRMAMSPAKGEELDGFLDQAIRDIERPAGTDGHSPGMTARLDKLLVPVLDLPDETPDAAAASAIAEAVAAGRELPADVLPELVSRLDTLDPPRPAVRRGLVAWATGSGAEQANALRAAFAITWADSDLLRRFAEGGLALIEARPESWRDFPDLEELRMSIDPGNPAAVNALVTQLADRIETAMPAHLRPAPDADPVSAA